MDRWPTGHLTEPHEDGRLVTDIWHMGSDSFRPPEDPNLDTEVLLKNRDFK